MNSYSDYLRDERMVDLYKSVVEPILGKLGNEEVFFYDELQKGFEEYGADPYLATEIFSGIILENEEFLSKSFDIEPLADLIQDDLIKGSAMHDIYRDAKTRKDPEDSNKYTMLNNVIKEREKRNIDSGRRAKAPTSKPKITLTSSKKSLGGQSKRAKAFVDKW